MTARWDPGLDVELEAALLDLAGAIAPVPAPRLAEAVRRRIEGRPAPQAALPLGARLAGWAERLVGGRQPLRRGLVLALVALLVVAGVAAAIGFGLPGLRIVILGPGPSGTPATATPPPATTPARSPAASGSLPPTPSPTAPALESLGLGLRVDPGGVDAAAGRHVLLPASTELGAPLAAFVRGTPPDAVVTLAYGPTPALPAGSLAPVDAGGPVAVLITELPGTTNGAYLEKMLPAGTTIDAVRVGGHAGFWIAGRPHELLYIAPNGDVIDEPARLAGNVLAWNDGAETRRIEGVPDLATAQRIAATLR